MHRLMYFLEYSRNIPLRTENIQGKIAGTMKLEIFKAALGLLVSLATLSIGWLVGQRLTVTWNLVQKRRETEIANVQQFYLVYGEFRELSKTWRLMKRTEIADVAARPAIRWTLLTRACALESKLESINIKLATEKLLHLNNLYTLGLFRQGIQRLRESIRDDLEIASSSRGVYYEHFNDLAARVATLISCDPTGPRPDANCASDQLRAIAAVTLANFHAAIHAYAEQHSVHIANESLPRL